jgi:hypothetical protein
MMAWQRRPCISDHDRLASFGEERQKLLKLA